MDVRDVTLAKSLRTRSVESTDKEKDDPEVMFYKHLNPHATKHAVLNFTNRIPTSYEKHLKPKHKPQPPRKFEKELNYRQETQKIPKASFLSGDEATLKPHLKKEVRIYGK
jgi:hypothetical protein